MLLVHEQNPLFNFRTPICLLTSCDKKQILESVRKRNAFFGNIRFCKFYYKFGNSQVCKQACLKFAFLKCLGRRFFAGKGF